MQSHFMFFLPKSIKSHVCIFVPIYFSICTHMHSVDTGIGIEINKLKKFASSENIYFVGLTIFDHVWRAYNFELVMPIFSKMATLTSVIHRLRRTHTHTAWQQKSLILILEYKDVCFVATNTHRHNSNTSIIQTFHKIK